MELIASENSALLDFVNAAGINPGALEAL